MNVVRSPQNAAVLREIGATHVVDSSEPDFEPALTEAIAETGATVGFDATGGGELASAVLAATERAQSQPDPGARYGSTVHKQVYVYGDLDPGPTILRRTYGMAWGVGGWLLTNFLYRIGSERVRALRRRVAAEIETTFRSEYSDTVSLAGALEPGAVARYTRKATGTKYLIAPQAPWSGP